MFFRIFKVTATRGFLTASECTKFVFGAGGAYSVPPDPLAGLRGRVLLRRGEGRGKEKGEEGRKREGMAGKVREGEATAPLTQIPGSAPGNVQCQFRFLRTFHVFELGAGTGQTDAMTDTQDP